MTDDWRDPSLAQRWSDDPTQFNPLREETVDVLLTLIEAVFEPGRTLLDLGSGSGLIEAALFERVPHAQVVGVDRSEPMMQLAAERMKAHPYSFIQVRHDLAEAAALAAPGVLPRQTYQIAFSVQALHHLTRDQHAAVYAALAQILMPGGWFFLLDRVAVEAPLFEAYSALWARMERTHGHAPKEGADHAAHQAMLARAGDHPLTAPDHLALLTAVGFTADVVYAHANRAIIAARKA